MPITIKTHDSRVAAMFHASTMSANPKNRSAYVTRSVKEWLAVPGIPEDDVSAIFFDDRLVWSRYPEDRQQNYFGRSLRTQDEAIEEIKGAK